MSEDRHIRSDSIYVSRQSRKGLILAAMKRSELVSADSLADEIIQAWLTKNEPAIIEHIEKQTEAEQAFKKSLRPKIPLG